MFESDFFDWFWWVLAIGFLVLEMLVTGFFFLWLALSAFFVGIVFFLISAISYESQFLLFSILAVVSVLFWRKFAKRHADKPSDQPLLNQRSAQYLDKVYTLVEPIENGQGKIMVEGTLWIVRGEDAKAGSKVRVISVEGTIFNVRTE